MEFYLISVEFSRETENLQVAKKHADASILFLLQLRKPVSTLSIPAAMKGPPGREGSVGGEEAGIALVGVHSDYPRYTEERSLAGTLVKVGKLNEFLPRFMVLSPFPEINPPFW